jgi:hypothetical protein
MGVREIIILNIPRKEQYMETELIKHYSWMASYLINGDASGLSKEQRDEADRFLKGIKEYYGPSASIVDCEEESEFGIPTWGGLKGDVIGYEILFKICELPREIWIIA